MSSLILNISQFGFQWNAERTLGTHYGTHFNGMVKGLLEYIKIFCSFIFILNLPPLPSLEMGFIGHPGLLKFQSQIFLFRLILLEICADFSNLNGRFLITVPSWTTAALGIRDSSSTPRHISPLAICHLTS